MKATRGIPSLAPRSYDEATSAVSETLTGVAAPKPSDMTDMTRRQFLTGVAAAGGAMALGWRDMVICNMRKLKRGGI